MAKSAIIGMTKGLARMSEGGAKFVIQMGPKKKKC
jgi:hypothetical protein